MLWSVGASNHSSTRFTDFEKYLRFDVDTVFTQKALLMNVHPILPLDAVPPYFSTQQLPANITMDKMSSVGYASTPWGVRVPLQYEHTVLRTQEHGQIWVQMDITGLALQMIEDPRFPGLVAEPVKLDNEEQKLVQILVQQHKETNELLIADLQVVKRADRVQPYRMRCGRLAMVQTSYDPSEWDEYGKYGTWARTQKLVFDKTSDFWSENVEDNALVFPLAMLLAFSVVMLRRWYQSRQQGMVAKADDVEIALLSSFEDAPPAYADIPVIKIEEYD